MNFLSKISTKVLMKTSMRKGYSLIEVTIAVAIVAVLGTLMFSGATRQISKARDSQRKDDLQTIKVAFEDYYNDNQCYPDPALFQNCGSEELIPYLREIPCDPEDGSPYMFDPLDGDVCNGYRILVQLENTNDPDIEIIGCDFITGCGYGDPTYNYGISMGTTIDSSDFPSATPTPGPTSVPSATPTPPLSGGVWVIAPDGTCSYYTNEYYVTAGCPASYATYDACFAVSGCMGSCSEDDVPLVLRCER